MTTDQTYYSCSQHPKKHGVYAIARGPSNGYSYFDGEWQDVHSTPGDAYQHGMFAHPRTRSGICQVHDAQWRELIEEELVELVTARIESNTS